MNDASSSPSPEALRTAAERLVATLAAHDDAEYRSTVLRRLARQLGEDDYPTFLRLLGIVAESDDEPAKRLLADAFGAALRRMDMPGGSLTSWGGGRLPEPSLALAMGVAAPPAGRTPRRLFGPVEYLTAWHLQQTQRPALDADTYRRTLALLVDLFNHSQDARLLYPQRLAADAENELEGAYTRATRRSLAAIARAWRSGLAPESVARAALESPDDAATRGWIVRHL